MRFISRVFELPIYYFVAERLMDFSDVFVVLRFGETTFRFVVVVRFSFLSRRGLPRWLPSSWWKTFGMCSTLSTRSTSWSMHLSTWCRMVLTFRFIKRNLSWRSLKWVKYKSLSHGMIVDVPLDIIDWLR